MERFYPFIQSINLCLSVKNERLKSLPKKGLFQQMLMEAIKNEEAEARRPVPKPVELSLEEILAERLKQLNIQENYIRYMLMAGIIT